MIRKDDVLDAIAECQGQRNPNANTCHKLASLYTILDHMESQELPILDTVPMMSADDASDQYIKYNSDSEFSRAVIGKRADDVIEIVDELMSTLEIVNPRLYNGVMRKVESL